MPALFAYLIAVGLLLGGGYGALSWLAAPESVKVVAKAKPKPPPRYEASSEVTETTSLTVSDSEHAASGSNDHPLSAGEEGAQAAISGSADDQQIRSAHAEVASREAKQNIQARPGDARQGG